MAIQRRSILKQAAILGIASIIVRAIGLLYRIPLSNIIGDLGNSYYGVAFNIYTILLLISGYSIPIAVSKIISGYIAVGQYKNARKSFILALIFIGCFGGFLSIVLYIFSPLFLPEGSANAIYALRCLSPTLFISGFIGVFQGYFQARRNTFPTAFAQILEQVANAVTSIFFAFILTRSSLEDEVNTATFGALGGTLGTLCGVIVSICILYYIYKLNFPRTVKELRKDKSLYTESYSTLTKILIVLIVPIIFSTIVTNFIGIINQYIYYGISSFKGLDMIDIGIKYGIYVGKVIPLSNVPSAVAYSVAVATLPTISAALARRNRREIHYRINESITLTMLFCAPASIGMFVLAKPIMDLLFSGTSSIGYINLRLCAIVILIVGYNTVLTSIIQGLGKPMITLFAGLASILANILVIVPQLLFTKIDIYAITTSAIVAHIVIAIISYRYIKSITRFKQNFIRTFFCPMFAALTMGITTFISYHLLHFLLRFNLIALLITIPLSIIIYGIIIIKLNFVNTRQLKSITIGRYFLRFLRKLNLI